MKNLLLCLASIAVLCVILTLGLWPFHAPRNQVTWLKDRSGLRFGAYGTVISSGTLQPTTSPDEASCSIEIWLERASNGNSGTMLAFYAPGHPVRFSLHQSRTDLMLQRGSSDPRVYVNNIFRRAQPVFVTITSGMRGLAVYVNGTLVRTARQFRPAASDCTGLLILGDSPLQPESWRGQVRGLAIYESELPRQPFSGTMKAGPSRGDPRSPGMNATWRFISSTSAPAIWCTTTPDRAWIWQFPQLIPFSIRSFWNRSGRSSICPGAIGRASSRIS